MMVVPAPRAIRSLSLSESSPKAVRVESSMANTKLTTANTPTITGLEDLSCPGMGVLLLLQSGGGATVRLPPVEFNRLEARQLANLSRDSHLHERRGTMCGSRPQDLEPQWEARGSNSPYSSWTR